VGFVLCWLTLSNFYQITSVSLSLYHSTEATYSYLSVYRPRYIIYITLPTDTIAK
jgi:hypothetical protein